MFFWSACYVHIIIDPHLDYYILCWTVEDINWTDAENYCSDYYNGHLASFNNQTDMNSFINLRNSLNLVKEIVFGYYSSSAEIGDEFVYTDNLQTVYTNWDTGQPDLPTSATLS